MAATPWWQASIPGDPSTYIPPHISYLEHLNSTRQQPQMGEIADLKSALIQLLVQRLNGNQQTWPIQSICQPQWDYNTWDYNTWDYIRSQVASMQETHITPEDPGDFSSSSSTPRFNTGHPISNQVTPMQGVRPNPEDTKNIEEPSSSPSTPRSDTSICSMGRSWRMAYNIEQCRQDEESDQLKDDCWQSREDKDYSVKEFRTNMDQLKKEHQTYRLSLYLQGKVFHNCLVDTRSNLNLISKEACLEAGFTPPESQDEEEDDQAIVVGVLEGVCIQAVGSKEQYPLDLTIVNFPGTRCFTPIRLGKKWVDSQLGSNSFSSYAQKDQIDEEHLLPMSPELEESLEEGETAQEDHEPEFIASEPAQLQGSEDEEESVQEALEQEFTTSVILGNVEFPNCMVSPRIKFSLMTYEACKGAGFIPTIAYEDDLAQIDSTYQMLGILRDVPIRSSISSPRHSLDIWVIDVPDVVTCILGRDWIQLSKQDECLPFPKDENKGETADKEPDVQYVNSSKANDEFGGPLHEEDLPDNSSICQTSKDQLHEEIIQEIDEHLPFEISVCFHPKGEIIHKCLVDPDMELNVMSYALCCETGLVSTMVKGGSPPFKGMLENVCIQPLGIEEQHVVDILVVDLPIPNPLVLSKEWVCIINKYSSLFDIIETEEESEEEKSSAVNHCPLEKDQNAEENEYEETLGEDLAFEFSFENQLAKTRLKEEMVDERHISESSSFTESNEPCLEDSFISPDPEIQELLGKDDEGKGSNILQDKSFEVSHSSSRPLQGELFVDDFFMDLFSSDQLSIGRFKKENIDDDPDYKLTSPYRNQESSVVEQEPPTEICRELVFKEFEQALYGETYDWSCQEDEQGMDIDGSLDSCTLLLDNGEDVPSNLESAIDEFPDPVYDDIEDSLFSRRYQSYRPTILLTNCLYFPSFGNEGIKDEDSQEQSLVADKVCTRITEITGNILHHEEVVKEIPLLTDAQNPYNSMQRIFVKVNSAFSWAHVGLVLQIFIFVGLVLQFLIQLTGLIHGEENVHFVHVGGDQNKIFDPGIRCT